MNVLRISGYNPKHTTTKLLYELFCQGGPIKNIYINRQDAFAIIRFHHDESVPYCLALFEGIEMHGRLLRMNPVRHNKNTNCYLEYLKAVRQKLRDEFAKINPPKLPPKSSKDDKIKCIERPSSGQKDKRSNRKKRSKRCSKFFN